MFTHKRTRHRRKLVRPAKPFLIIIESSPLAERYVSNRRIEEVFRKSSVFERLSMNIGIRVKFGRNTSRDGIEFHTCASRARIQTLRHQSEEMTHTHGRFKDVAAGLQSKPLQRLPNRLNDFWRC